MKTSVRRFYCSFAFVFGAASIPLLFWLFPTPGSTGYGATFILIPLWGAAFFLSLVWAITTTPGRPGFQYEVGYYAVAVVLLLTITMRFYSSPEGEQPVREVRTALSVWWTESMTYDELYDAYWQYSYHGENWQEVRYAAAVQMYRDSLPDVACRVRFDRSANDNSAQQRIEEVRLERRADAYTTTSNAVTATRLESEAVQLQDRFGNTHRISLADPLQPQVLDQSATEVYVQVICVRPGPERLSSGFVSLFYSFLTFTDWP